jgi:Helix-turn-helix family
MEPTPTLARRFWAAIEPIHAIVYFAPEPVEAARKTGLRGFWMSYFASRVAPLGPVPAEAVGAMAYGFAPAMVARAIPDAWRFAAPAAVLEARLSSAPESLRHHVDAACLADAKELSGLLWEAVAGCRFDGRPLAAAWSAVPRPSDDDVAAAWLAATILREHRGDGHVLAGVAAGLRGIDASVTFAATGAITREMIQPTRGWNDEDWEQSVRRLQARGLLDSGGRLTKTGGALRRDVEDVTDRLAAGPVERLGSTGVERAIELATPISRHLVDTGVIPVPNPIGAPRP